MYLLQAPHIQSNSASSSINFYQSKSFVYESWRVTSWKRIYRVIVNTYINFIDTIETELHNSFDRGYENELRRKQRRCGKSSDDGFIFMVKRYMVESAASKSIGGVSCFFALYLNAKFEQRAATEARSS